LNSDKSPAFSHCFLKRLRALSKDSSGSTMTLVTLFPPSKTVPWGHLWVNVNYIPSRAALRYR
jgi:hypothetical protein